MDLMQWALAWFVLVVFPLLGWRKIAALRRSPSEPGRISMYRRSLLSLWIATVAAWTLGQGPGLMTGSAAGAAWAHCHRWLAGAAVVAVCGFFVVAIGQGLACLRNAARRRQLAPAFDALRFLLPVSRPGRRWWVLLSVSAGICEELLYRGFLTQFLLGELDGGVRFDLPGAWLFSSALFGLAHLYQGVRGVLTSTAMGLVFGLLAICTGSLWLPIVLHTVIDLQVLWMCRPDLDREAQPGTLNLDVQSRS